MHFYVIRSPHGPWRPASLAEVHWLLKCMRSCPALYAGWSVGLGYRDLQADGVVVGDEPQVVS